MLAYPHSLVYSTATPENYVAACQQWHALQMHRNDLSGELYERTQEVLRLEARLSEQTRQASVSETALHSKLTESERKCAGLQEQYASQQRELEMVRQQRDQSTQSVRLAVTARLTGEHLKHSSALEQRITELEAQVHQQSVDHARLKEEMRERKAVFQSELVQRDARLEVETQNTQRFKHQVQALERRIRELKAQHVEQIDSAYEKNQQMKGEYDRIRAEYKKFEQRQADRWRPKQVEEKLKPLRTNFEIVWRDHLSMIDENEHLFMRYNDAMSDVRKLCARLSDVHTKYAIDPADPQFGCVQLTHDNKEQVDMYQFARNEYLSMPVANVIDCMLKVSSDILTLRARLDKHRRVHRFCAQSLPALVPPHTGAESVSEDEMKKRNAAEKLCIQMTQQVTDETEEALKQLKSRPTTEYALIVAPS